MLLRPALSAFDPIFATTNGNFALREGIDRIHVLPDSNRDRPLQAIKCLWQSMRLVWSIRPNVLISTGALPGLFCLVTARLLGARTIWIDSVANSDQPSLSGRCAGPFTSLWLTQWPMLADGKRVSYLGALL